MFYKSPTKREAFNGALLESYHVENEESTLKLGSISGGYIQHSPESKKSSFYIVQGIGEVLVKGSEIHNVEGGEIFELKENSSFKLDGQLKYINVINAEKTTIEHISSAANFEENASYFIYILDGVGTLVRNGKKDVVREGYFIELNGKSATQLKASNMKCLVAKLA